MIADLPPGATLDDVSANKEDVGTQKIWQFRSPKNYAFDVQTNRLAITSEYHKTYNLGQGDRFREVIQYVMDAFLSVTGVPILTRIGLRYLDECPLPAKDNVSLSNYYDTSFPLSRFSIADATEMRFQTVVKTQDAFFRYAETLLNMADGSNKLLLDFDGFREKISARDYLAVTDQLHNIISDEFEKTIKQPVYDFMRKPRGA